MNIQKCKTCQHYESFFGSCNLYYKEVYLGEGDFDTQPISIESIDESECEYKKIKE